MYIVSTFTNTKEQISFRIFILCKCRIAINILEESGRQIANDSRVSVERVTEPYGLSEGPHWDQRSQKLYFVDIYNQYIRRLDPATEVVTNAHIENDIVGVVPVYGSPDKLVTVVGKNVALITWDGKENKEEVPIEILCSVDEKSIKTRINDGKVDPLEDFG